MKRLPVLFLFMMVFATIHSHCQTTSWWKKTVVYQIYPRSFCDTDGNGIGDLQGIISKLDYLKNLGVETIWISPFFKSPQQDFGYDISDYYTVDPLFGDSAKAHQLIQEIHQRDMYVVFDLVMNHTSIEHEWFKASAKDSINPKADWYVWNTGKKNNTQPPNNWKATIGGSGWHYHEGRDQWYFSSFLPFQPDLNYHNPDTKAAMLNVAKYWLDQGVDGFRLDIFNVIYHDLSFKDNPFSPRIVPSAENPDGFFQKMKYTVNHDQNYTFAKELRALLDSYDTERFAVGEVFGDDPTIQKYLGDDAYGLNLVFQFDMLAFDFTAAFFREKIESYNTFYASPLMPTLVFSNHDRKRSISRIDNDVDKAKLLTCFQLTGRGVPFIYQGEEFGMEQAHIPIKDALDPLAQMYDWMPQFLVNFSGESLNRDESRTPMQWDDSKNAGFCDPSATPWLPVNDNHSLINAEAAQKDSHSIWTLYQQLLYLRKNHPALQSGDIEVIHTPKSDKILAYRRTAENETLEVFLNFSKKPLVIDYPTTNTSILFSLHPETKAELDQILLEGYSAVILSK